MIYIPTGFAHGFLSLKDNSELIYLSSKNYNPLDEKGYLWNSFGFKWPVSKPVISKRDTLHPDFKIMIKKDNNEIAYVIHHINLIKTLQTY